MRATRLFFVVLLLAAIESFADEPLKIREGVNRDEKCAIRVGEAILISVYGEKHVRGGLPFHAELDEDRWFVHQLPSHAKGGEPFVGGGYHVTIARQDGRILEIGLDE